MSYSIRKSDTGADDAEWKTGEDNVCVALIYTFPPHLTSNSIFILLCRL